MLTRVRCFAFALLLSLALPGCFAPLDLTHRSCPCTDGWTCDPTTMTCVQGTLDAAMPIDAFRSDAAAISDSGTDAFTASDAHLDDAGMDAAVIADTGTDAYVPSVDGGHDGGTDTGVDAAVVCSARICDDFESPVASRIPPWQWTLGAASRSTALAHGGVASGHFSAPATGGGDRQQAIGVNLTSTITDVWLRFYAYVPAASVPDDIGITSIADAPGTNISILLQSGGWAFYAAGPDVYRGTVPLTHDHWTCVSSHTVLAASGSITVTIDGLTPLTATGINTAFPTGLDNVEIGLTFVDVSQMTAFDYYIDGVTLTVDGTALPCP